MEVRNYPSNSNRSKEEAQAKKIEKVVKGAVAKRPSTVRKFTDSFFKSDLDAIKDYIIFDVIIPSAKKAFVTAVNNSLSMMFFGEIKSDDNRRTTADTVSYRYDQCYSNERRVDRRQSACNYADVTVETKREAEAVLSQLDDILARYDMVTVADFYESVGMATEYTDLDYGWKNIASAKIVMERNGKYRICMPRVVPLPRRQGGC